MLDKNNNAQGLFKEMRFSTEGTLQEAIDVAAPFIARLKQKPEVTGIILLGGLGERQWIDKFSDIDLAVVTSALFSGLPPFSFYVYHGARKYEFNVSQLNLDSEQNSEWNSDKRQAYFTGRVIYDPDGEISRLLEKKLSRNLISEIALLQVTQQQM